MKKILSYADICVAIAGIGGAALRQWMLSGGTDDHGLYPASHPGWIGLLILGAVVLGFSVYISRQDSPIPARHPLFHTVGAFIAAVGLGFFGVTHLSGITLIAKMAAVLSIISAIALALWGAFRLPGKAAPGWSHALPCLTFALFMLLEAQTASHTSQLSRYILQLAAFGAGSIAFYQQWGFDVQQGSEKACLFWRLTALYFCLVAIPGANGLLFGCCAVYFLEGHRNA